MSSLSEIKSSEIRLEEGYRNLPTSKRPETPGIAQTEKIFANQHLGLCADTSTLGRHLDSREFSNLGKKKKKISVSLNNPRKKSETKATRQSSAPENWKKLGLEGGDGNLSVPRGRARSSTMVETKGSHPISGAVSSFMSSLISPRSNDGSRRSLKNEDQLPFQKNKDLEEGYDNLSPHRSSRGRSSTVVGLRSPHSEEEEYGDPLIHSGGRDRSSTVVGVRSPHSEEEEEEIFSLQPSDTVFTSVDIPISLSSDSSEQKQLSNSKKKRFSISLKNPRKGHKKHQKDCKKPRDFMQKSSSLMALPRRSSKESSYLENMPRAESFRTYEDENLVRITNPDVLDQEALFEIIESLFYSKLKPKYTFATALYNRYSQIDSKQLGKVLFQLYSSIDSHTQRKSFCHEAAFLVTTEKMAPCIWHLTKNLANDREKELDEEFFLQLYKICIQNEKILRVSAVLTKFEISLAKNPSTLFREDSLLSKLNTTYLVKILTKKGFFKGLKKQLDREFKNLNGKTVVLSNKEDAKTFAVFAHSILSYLYSQSLPIECVRLLNTRYRLVEAYDPKFSITSIEEAFFFRIINPFFSNPKLLAHPSKKSVLIPLVKILQNISSRSLFGEEKPPQFNELINKFQNTHENYLQDQCTMPEETSGDRLVVYKGKL